MLLRFAAIFSGLSTDQIAGCSASTKVLMDQASTRFF